jgi:glycosyltransferase involved in cell wall biosynthesis
MTKEANLRPTRSLTVFYLCYNQWDIIASSLLNLASALSRDIIYSVKVVICDDCSDRDNSNDLLLRLDCYSDLIIDIYRNSVNLGPGPSRNYLLSICSTTHFCFVDGDDEISPAAIHEFFQVTGDFEIYQFPLLIGGKHFSTDASRVQRLHLSFLYPWAASAKASRKLIFSSCSRIVSLSFARKHSYQYTQCRRFEDILPYAICFVYARSIKFCLEPLVFVNFSLASGSRNVRLYYYRYLFDSLRSLWGFGFPSSVFAFLSELTLLSAASVTISYLRSFFFKYWRSRA